MARSIIPDSSCPCKSRKRRRQQHTASLVPPTIPAEGTYIEYDPDTGDYAMYLDAQFIGFARTYHDAEITLQDLIDEIAFQTRVMTADMQAEAAEMRLEREAA
jgi:hypothetical protein